MSSKTIVFITGANRGIGRALVGNFLQRPDNTVIATVRDLSAETSKTLSSLPTHASSRLITVALESSSETSAQAAVERLKAEHDISHLDIVIANAGIGTWATAAATTAADLRQHFLINSIAPLLLFQAVLPLLRAGPKDGNPRFIPVSSVLGSIAYVDSAPLPDAAYGASKAALNFLTRKIHQENVGLTAFAVHPGWIDTPLGNESARTAGLAKAPNSLTEGDNVESLVTLFENATREKSSGRFLNYDGSELPW